jgi:tRNA(Arg) A34 adenosine deaminase TadA
MIPPAYKPKKKFMQLAIAEAKRARDRGDYAIGAVITQLIGNREVVIASAGNRVKTSGSSIKHVELETLKYVCSGYGRYLPDFVLYSTHEPCAMCAGACVWSKVGAKTPVQQFHAFPAYTCVRTRRSIPRSRTGQSCRRRISEDSRPQRNRVDYGKPTRRTKS